MITTNAIKNTVNFVNTLIKGEFKTTDLVKALRNTTDEEYLIAAHVLRSITNDMDDIFRAVSNNMDDIDVINKIYKVLYEEDLYRDAEFAYREYREYIEEENKELWESMEIEAAIEDASYQSFDVVWDEFAAKTELLDDVKRYPLAYNNRNSDNPTKRKNYDEIVEWYKNDSPKFAENYVDSAPAWKKDSLNETLVEMDKNNAEDEKNGRTPRVLANAMTNKYN